MRGTRIVMLMHHSALNQMHPLLRWATIFTQYFKCTALQSACQCVNCSSSSWNNQPTAVTSTRSMSMQQLIRSITMHEIIHQCSSSTISDLQHFLFNAFYRSLTHNSLMLAAQANDEEKMTITHGKMTIMNVHAAQLRLDTWSPTTIMCAVLKHLLSASSTF